jgi:hypothetical protein
MMAEQRAWAMARQRFAAEEIIHKLHLVASLPAGLRQNLAPAAAHSAQCFQAFVLAMLHCGTAWAFRLWGLQRRFRIPPHRCNQIFG